MSKKQQSKRTIMTVPLDAETKDAIDKLADADNRTTAAYVRLVLARHVSEVGSQNTSQQPKPETTAA